ncbi:hypothetical protein ACOSQ4_024535 [Xanthoceras sorbifolium]
MNENAKRLLTLEAENKVVHAENKDQLTKVESLTTSATPPPRFGHTRYEINANPSPAHGQTTPPPEPVMLDPIAPMPITSTAQKLGSLHLQGTHKTRFVRWQQTHKTGFVRWQRTQFLGSKLGSFVGNEPSVSGFVEDHGFVDVQRTQIWDR